MQVVFPGRGDAASPVARSSVAAASADRGDGAVDRFGDGVQVAAGVDLAGEFVEQRYPTGAARGLPDGGGA